MRIDLSVERAVEGADEWRALGFRGLEGRWARSGGGQGAGSRVRAGGRL